MKCPRCGLEIPPHVICVCGYRVTKFTEWPRWARILKRLKCDGECGVGDTFRRLQAEDPERVADWARKHGLLKTCPRTKHRWNMTFSY